MAVFSVRCWPFGEGEEEDEGVGTPEFFSSIDAAKLRAIEEIADWAYALIDPENGDAPSDEENPGSMVDYCRNGSMEAFDSIRKLSELAWLGPNDRYEAEGPCGNDVVVIEQAR